MLNKNLLRGHSPLPWHESMGDLYDANDDLIIYGEGIWFSPYEEGDTLYDERDKANEALFMASPQLLAEHDALCELVGLYEKLTGGAMMSREQYNDVQLEITTLRGRLQIE